MSAAPTPKLDVLIIGCGNIAGGFDAARDSALPALTHAGAFSRNPAFRLTACVEPDTEKRAAFMARWGIAQGAADVAQLPPGQSYDVVSICSPTAFHADHLVQAIALRPRLVFCEKPVTPDVALTAALVHECAEAGILLAVNHTRRWAPDVVALRDDLRAGKWGELRSIAGTYNKGLLNNGSHLIDLVQFLAGSVTPVSASSPVHDFWPDDPTVAALLDAQGVPFHMIPAHAGDYSVFELQLNMARGILVMENGGMAWRIRTSTPSPDFAGYRTLAPSFQAEGSYPLAMGLAVSNIHAALETGAPLASTGESALQAQKACDALRHLAIPCTPT